MTIKVGFGKFIRYQEDKVNSLMNGKHPENSRRILIVSSHPLFGKGLKSLLNDRFGEKLQIVGLVTNVDDAIDKIILLSPDIVIVDYDDHEVNREAFLARFVEGNSEIRIVLISLNEENDAVVYDRRTMTAAHIEDWL